ncbi:Holliday junction ATP-dependent DNA helicase RuvA [Myxococcaceae bacterium]|jgi:Holliday junction DNA helicase RuvA|nr:Holliday junction ATP-dependent DNA helicase RuvA [Myxococcaceae bacterium]
MIAWLEGLLREKTASRVVIAAGGVGYEAWIPVSTYAALPDEGKTVALHVHTHVRDDAIVLYGFSTSLERTTFELLLRTSGVGPRLAIGLLSGLEPERLLDALRKGAVATLRAVPGVGPKMAERLVVELRERAAELVAGLAEAPAGSGGSPRDAAAVDPAEEALSALLNLGYPRAQAQRAVEESLASLGPGTSLERVLRDALRRSLR